MAAIRFSPESCPPVIRNIPGRKMDHLKIHFLVKMGIFHCHVSLLEGIFSSTRRLVESPVVAESKNVSFNKISMTPLVLLAISAK